MNTVYGFNPDNPEATFSEITVDRAGGGFVRIGKRIGEPTPGTGRYNVTLDKGTGSALEFALSDEAMEILEWLVPMMIDLDPEEELEQ